MDEVKGPNIKVVEHPNAAEIIMGDTVIVLQDIKDVKVLHESLARAIKAWSKKK